VRRPELDDQCNEGTDRFWLELESVPASPPLFHPFRRISGLNETALLDELSVDRPEVMRSDRADVYPDSQLLLCDSNCYGKHNETACGTLPCHVTGWEAEGHECAKYSKKDTLFLFCLQEFWAGGLENYEQECSAIGRRIAAAVGYQLLAAISIPAINAALQAILEALAKFEGKSAPCRVAFAPLTLPPQSIPQTAPSRRPSLTSS